MRRFALLLVLTACGQAPERSLASVSSASPLSLALDACDSVRDLACVRRVSDRIALEADFSPTMREFRSTTEALCRRIADLVPHAEPYACAGKLEHTASSLALAFFDRKTPRTAESCGEADTPRERAECAEATAFGFSALLLPSEDLLLERAPSHEADAFPFLLSDQLESTRGFCERAARLSPAPGKDARADTCHAALVESLSEVVMRTVDSADP